MTTLNPEVLHAQEMLWADNATTRFVSVSALTFYAWDFSLTLADEVEYFWCSRRSLVKFLFFVNRYLTFALVIITTFLGTYYHPNTEICFTWATLSMLTGILSATVVQVILQIRVHALYGQNKRLLIFVSTLFALEIGSIVTIMSLKLSHVGLQKMPAFVPLNPFCSVVLPRYFFAFWIPFMGFDFILLGLVTHKAALHYQQLPDKSWSSATLMSILIRDSVLYFVCNFAVFLCNALMWQLGPLDLTPLATTWALVAPATAAGRLLINMRKAYRPMDVILHLDSDNLTVLG